MKILIISHMYPSSIDETYGIFVHNLVKAIQKKGVEVRVVSPVPYLPKPFGFLKKSWGKFAQVPLEEIFDGVLVYHPRYLLLPKSFYFNNSGTRMFKWIDEAIEKVYKKFEFDLIHAHVALPDGQAVSLLSKKYHVPFILTIHGIDFFKTILNYRNRKAIEEVIESSAKTVVVSNRLREIGKEKLHVNQLKFEIIANGVDLFDVDLEFNKMVNKLEESKKDDIWILSTGFLIKRKGLEFAIRGFGIVQKKHSNLRYLIIGDGEERHNLEVLVKNLGLDKNVSFLGRLSNKKTVAYMRACDVFLLPSWNEAFGVVYIESMSQGKPVIGCKGEGIEDFVIDGYDGLLIRPKNVQDIVEVLGYLIENPDKAFIMGKRAKEKVIRDFTWDIIAEKYITIYTNALKNRVL